MTRSDEPLFEPRIADWLEDDPYMAPDQALAVVLAAFPSIKQRRAWRVPWRFPNVNGMTRIALAGAAIVAVAVGGLFVLNRGPSGPGGPGGPTPSATATPSPTASAKPTPEPTVAPTVLPPLDTTDWVPYTSSRYGYTISYPPTDWVAIPGDHDWSFETDPGGAFNSTAPDRFETGGAADGLGILLSVWSDTVLPATTLEDWMDSYCVAEGRPSCSDVTDLLAGAPQAQLRILGWKNASGEPMAAFRVPAVPSEPGLLATVYVAAIWRSEGDPSVRPWGGSQRLLEAFLTTLTLDEEAPAGSPAPS